MTSSQVWQQQTMTILIMIVSHTVSWAQTICSWLKCCRLQLTSSSLKETEFELGTNEVFVTMKLNCTETKNFHGQNNWDLSQSKSKLKGKSSTSKVKRTWSDSILLCHPPTNTTQTFLCNQTSNWAQISIVDLDNQVKMIF